MASQVEVLFPPVPLGVRNTVQTIAELRALDSTQVDAQTEVLVDGSGFFNYDPSSLLADNGTSVIKPNDLTSLQAGRWLIVNIINASNVTYTADDPEAVQRTLGGKLGDWVNVLDFHDPADGDNLTTAIQNAIYFAFPTEPRLLLNIPAGVWVIDEQIIVPRPVHIKGAGLMETILDFQNVSTVNATMKGAFSFGLNSTLLAYNSVAYASQVKGISAYGADGGSDFSQVSDLSIATTSSVLDYGIWTAGRLFCANVLVFGGGFKVIAGTLQDGPGSVTGNANICVFNNCHSVNASQDGFFTNGSDANACTFVGCNAFDPTRYAYYDASFLGNTYTSCHGSGGTTTFKALLGAGTNKTMFDGCYAETGVGIEWDVPSPAMIVNPKGELPASPSTASNVALLCQYLTGLVANRLTFLNDYGNNTFGSSSVPAADGYAGGFRIRGQGDGDYYQWVAKGQEQGGSAGYGDGVSFVKRDGVSGTNYQLAWLGDARNKWAFPNGFIGTFPGPYADNAAALGAGLTAGEVYRVTTTNVLAVVV